MESRSWGARIGELSTLIYLIFPILAIFLLTLCHFINSFN